MRMDYNSAISCSNAAATTVPLHLATLLTSAHAHREAKPRNSACVCAIHSIIATCEHYFAEVYWNIVSVGIGFRNLFTYKWRCTVDPYTARSAERRLWKLHSGGSGSLWEYRGPFISLLEGGHTLESFYSFISLYGCLSLEILLRGQAMFCKLTALYTQATFKWTTFWRNLENGG